MLDFGFSEIVLTSAIALIVLGPEKLPKVARQVGAWMGRARAMARQLTEQLEREVNAEDLMRHTKGTSSSAPVPFDTSYTPPSNVAPAATSEPVQAAPTYSAQPSQPPHGADWHPAPPENKSSDG